MPNVTQLSAHESIKLPEFVVFLVLRDPPGDMSSAEWSKGSELSASVSVSITDNRGFETEMTGVCTRSHCMSSW